MYMYSYRHADTTVGLRPPLWVNLGQLHVDASRCVAHDKILLRSCAQNPKPFMNAHPANKTPKRKIGRASCRARVCQYVWISVVTVALKKKEEYNTRRTSNTR